MANNPDGTDVVSNPFDVAAMGGGSALVADAGANDLLIVENRGTIDWVVALPVQLVSTANVKALAGCPSVLPELEFVCGFPGEVPAQPVATSVAIGPDGAYYVGESKGFPALTGKGGASATGQGVDSRRLQHVPPGRSLQT